MIDGLLCTYKWVAEVGRVVGVVRSTSHDIECLLSAGSRLLKQRGALLPPVDCERVRW